MQASKSLASLQLGRSRPRTTQLTPRARAIRKADLIQELCDDCDDNTFLFINAFAIISSIIKYPLDEMKQSLLNF